MPTGYHVMFDTGGQVTGVHKAGEAMASILTLPPSEVLRTGPRALHAAL